MSALATAGKQAVELAKIAALDLITPNYDPVPEYRFFVFVDMGFLEWAAGFSGCSGLKMTRSVQEIEEGGLNHYVHKLPAVSRFDNITLTRGIAFSSTLWEWYYKEVEQGSTRMYDITIMQYSSYTPPFLPARFYHLFDCFPVAWSGPNFSVDSRAIAVESLEIAYQRMEIESVIATEVAAVAEIIVGTAARIAYGIANAVS